MKFAVCNGHVFILLKQRVRDQTNEALGAIFGGMRGRISCDSFGDGLNMVWGGTTTPAEDIDKPLIGPFLNQSQPFRLRLDRISQTHLGDQH